MNSSRNKILLFLVGILLLTNIVLVIFFVGKKEPERQGRPRQDRSSVMKSYLKDSVGFSDEQLSRYESIRTAHDEKMKGLFEQMRNAKIEFYQLINKPETADSASRVAASLIGERQEAVDLAFLAHFQEVRKLCHPEQQSKYDSLVQRVIRKMVSPPRRGDSKEKREHKAIKK